MTRKEIQTEVSRILREEMSLEISAPESDLIEAGQMDSLALVELLAHLETRFAVSIDMSELDIDDVRSPARIAGFVARHLQAA